MDTKAIGYILTENFSQSNLKYVKSLLKLKNYFDVQTSI